MRGDGLRSRPKARFNRSSSRLETRRHIPLPTKTTHQEFIHLTNAQFRKKNKVEPVDRYYLDHAKRQRVIEQEFKSRGGGPLPRGSRDDRTHATSAAAAAASTSSTSSSSTSNQQQPSTRDVNTHRGNDQTDVNRQTQRLNSTNSDQNNTKQTQKKHWWNNIFTSTKTVSSQYPRHKSFTFSKHSSNIQTEHFSTKPDSPSNPLQQSTELLSQYRTAGLYGASNPHSVDQTGSLNKMKQTEYFGKNQNGSSIIIDGNDSPSTISHGNLFSSLEPPNLLNSAKIASIKDDETPILRDSWGLSKKSPTHIPPTGNGHNKNNNNLNNDRELLQNVEQSRIANPYHKSTNGDLTDTSRQTPKQSKNTGNIKNSLDKLLGKTVADCEDHYLAGKSSSGYLNSPEGDYDDYQRIYAAYHPDEPQHDAPKRGRKPKNTTTTTTTPATATATPTSTTRRKFASVHDSNSFTTPTWLTELKEKNSAGYSKDPFDNPPIDSTTKRGGRARQSSLGLTPAAFDRQWQYDTLNQLNDAKIAHEVLSEQRQRESYGKAGHLSNKQTDRLHQYGQYHHTAPLSTIDVDFKMSDMYGPTNNDQHPNLFPSMSSTLHNKKGNSKRKFSTKRAPPRSSLTNTFDLYIEGDKVGFKANQHLENISSAALRDNDHEYILGHQEPKLRRQDQSSNRNNETAAVFDQRRHFSSITTSPTTKPPTRTIATVKTITSIPPSILPQSPSELKANLKKISKTPPKTKISKHNSKFVKNKLNNSVDQTVYEFNSPSLSSSVFYLSQSFQVIRPQSPPISPPTGIMTGRGDIQTKPRRGFKSRANPGSMENARFNVTPHVPTEPSNNHTGPVVDQAHKRVDLIFHNSPYFAKPEKSTVQLNANPYLDYFTPKLGHRENLMSYENNTPSDNNINKNPKAESASYLEENAITPREQFKIDLHNEPSLHQSPKQHSWNVMYFAHSLSPNHHYSPDITSVERKLLGKYMDKDDTSGLLSLPYHALSEANINPFQNSSLMSTFAPDRYVETKRRLHKLSKGHRLTPKMAMDEKHRQVKLDHIRGNGFNTIAGEIKH